MAPRVDARVETLPLWWRKVPVGIVTGLRRQFRTSGSAPQRRLRFSEFIQTAQEPLSNLAAGHPRQPLIEALQLVERKLDWVLRLASPDNYSMDERMVPRQVLLTQDGITVWEETPDVAVGDVLEMRITLVPGTPLEMDCLVRLERLLPDLSSGMVRLECRFEAMRDQDRDNLERSEVELTWEDEEEESEPTRLASPPPVEKPLPEQPPEPETEAEADNRRAFFRINDRLPFSWKRLATAEAEPMLAYFRTHRLFPTRPSQVMFLSLLQGIALREEEFEQVSPRGRRLVEWFRKWLDQRHQLANTPEEEGFYHGLAMSWLELTREMIDMGGNFRPRQLQLLSFLRQKLELQQKLGERALPKDPQKRQEIQTAVKMTAQQLAEALDKEDTHGERRVMERFRGVVKTIERADLRPDFKVGESAEVMADGRVVRPVNVSANGLAFRTSKIHDTKAGDHLELAMTLIPDGVTQENVTVLVRVVRVLPVEQFHQVRVACQIEAITSRERDILFRHIVRLQRETLAKRIDPTTVGKGR